MVRVAEVGDEHAGVECEAQSECECEWGGGGSGGAVIGPSPPQAVSVRRLGALRWAELVVFAVAGSWMPSTPEPAARVALAGVSRHAARRAGVVGDRLPTAGALEASVVTVPADPGLVAVVADLEVLVPTADRLAVLGDVVLGGIADALDALVRTLSPVADATSLRTLPPLVDDLRADAAALGGCGRRLGLVATPGVADGFADRVVALGGW